MTQAELLQLKKGELICLSDVDFDHCFVNLQRDVLIENCFLIIAINYKSIIDNIYGLTMSFLASNGKIERFHHSLIMEKI